MALLRLAVISGDVDTARRAITALRSARALMARFPAAAGNWLGALDFYLSTPKEVAIVGDPRDAATRELVGEVFRRYLPNRVMVGSAEGGEPGGGGELGGGEPRGGSIPLLVGRTAIDGKPAAYVCENYVCGLPTTDAGELARQLGV